MLARPRRAAIAALPALLLALPAALLLPGCKSAPQYAAPADAVAAYFYTDHVHEELVALRPGGQYVQTIRNAPRDSGPAATRPRAPLPNALPVTFPLGYAHTGSWRLLDKPGGAVVALPASPPALLAALSHLPPDAVVELHGALPFGLVWENQPPRGLRDETIPAAQFRPAKP